MNPVRNSENKHFYNIKLPKKQGEISNGVKTLYLPTNLRKELKRPFGTPLFGNKKEVIKKFKKFLERIGAEKIITVGDYCSFTIPSDIKIFDGRIKRKKIKKPLSYSLTCKNQPGTIQKEVWPIIKKAIKENKNVFVEGEEDLLVIPTVLLSDKKTLVIYGLPNKGICLIKVSPQIKKVLKELLKKFKTK